MSDGSHTITFWSVDNAGNVEATHTVTFTEDTVAPTTTLTTAPAAPDGSNGWFLEGVGVTLTATDATSGVASTSYTVDGGSDADLQRGVLDLDDGVAHRDVLVDRQRRQRGVHALGHDQGRPRRSGVDGDVDAGDPQDGWYASRRR